MVITEFNPQIPWPSDHGWKETDGKLTSTMPDQFPTPQYSIEMSSHTSKNIHCVEDLTCTDLFKRDDCHNIETRFTAEEDPETESSDDD